jgi:hypothetical protein
MSSCLCLLREYLRIGRSELGAGCVYLGSILELRVHIWRLFVYWETFWTYSFMRDYWGRNGRFGKSWRWFRALRGEGVWSVFKNMKERIGKQKEIKSAYLKVICLLRDFLSIFFYERLLGQEWSIWEKLKAISSVAWRGCLERF